MISGTLVSLGGKTSDQPRNQINAWKIIKVAHFLKPYKLRF